MSNYFTVNDVVANVHIGMTSLQERKTQRGDTCMSIK